MNTNLKYDVIIPIKYDDLGNIRTLIENVRRTINEVRDIVILTKVSKVQKDVVSELREKKVHLIEEDTLLPGITFDRVRSILEKNKGDVSSAEETSPLFFSSMLRTRSKVIPGNNVSSSIK